VWLSVQSGGRGGGRGEKWWPRVLVALAAASPDAGAGYVGT
jgi:hypothetical protein